MTALAVTAAVVTAGGAVYQGAAANEQAKYERAIADQNAKLEEASRRDAISRGETAQINHWRKLSQAMGEARVRNSANMLDVGFGSAAGLEEDIALIGNEDSRTLSENTTKEIQGYDIRAANYRAEGKAATMRGKAAKTAGYISAAGTLLSSASQIGQMNVNRGYNWYGGPKKTPTPTSSGFVGPRP